MDDLERPHFRIESLVDTPVAELVELLEAQANRLPKGDSAYEPIHVEPWQGLQWLATDPNVVARVREKLDQLGRSHAFEHLSSHRYERERREEDLDKNYTRAKKSRTLYTGFEPLRLLVIRANCDEPDEELLVTVVASTDDYAETRARYRMPPPKSPEEEEWLIEEEEEADRREALDRANMLQLLADVARDARNSLGDSSRHLVSVVPTPHAFQVHGFSAEVPKEGHLRALFWSRIRETSPLECELDWTVYGLGHRGIECVGDVALAGFERVVHSRYSSWESRGPALPDLLLEFERIWLRVDAADIPAAWSRVANRVQGLRRALAALAIGRHRPCIAGVVVATFGADPARSREVIDALKSRPEMRGTKFEILWEDRVPTLLTPSALLGRVQMRETYLRFDLIGLAWELDRGTLS